MGRGGGFKYLPTEAIFVLSPHQKLVGHKKSFLAGNQLHELQTNGRMMMMWLSKKNIAIFSYKHWHLSLDMKTKVVQHSQASFLVFSKFSKFLGSQRLSDFQTFLAGYIYIGIGL